MIFVFSMTVVLCLSMTLLDEGEIGLVGGAADARKGRTPSSLVNVIKTDRG